MKKRDLFDTLLVLACAALGVEVLVRRWYFEQVPSQLNGYLVYALLLVVLYVLVRQARHLWELREARQSAGRVEKNG
jgi:hypothetical protein